MSRSSDLGLLFGPNVNHNHDQHNHRRADDDHDHHHDDHLDHDAGGPADDDDHLDDDRGRRGRDHDDEHYDRGEWLLRRLPVGVVSAGTGGRLGLADVL